MQTILTPTETAALAHLLRQAAFLDQTGAVGVVHAGRFVGSDCILSGADRATLDRIATKIIGRGITRANRGH